MAEAGKKSRQFRAEVRKVLHILTNSLYTNREIFLRELVSNASDALDKLRYRMNRGESPRLPDLPLEIRLTLDKEAKILTIADTGVGMTAEELAEGLTWAPSPNPGRNSFWPIWRPRLPRQAKKRRTTTRTKLRPLRTRPISSAALAWVFIPFSWWQAR